MSDITKCEGTNCPLKETCYRFTAPMSEYRQSMFVETPLKLDGTCDEYWEDKYEYKTKLEDE